MLTPKCKVRKVLKKEKKNRFNDLKLGTAKNRSHQSQRRTENHWRTGLETYPLWYQDDADQVTN